MTCCATRCACVCSDARFKDVVQNQMQGPVHLPFERMVESPCIISCPHAEILNAPILDLLFICCAVQAGLKHENGRKVARSGSLQRMASAEHPAKKGCHGRTSKPEQAFKPEEAG